MLNHKTILEEQLRAISRGSPYCPVLLSSRYVGYTPSSLPEVNQWQLLPFSPLQLRVAIYKWLSDYPEAAKTIITTIKRTPPLIELLTNPLLLSLACHVWKEALRNNEALALFSRRTDLYQRFINRFRGRWIERMQLKGRAPTLSEQEAFLPFLEDVAWQLWHHDLSRTVFSGNEICKVIMDLQVPQTLKGRVDLFEDICESGILIKVGPQETEAPYSFLHRTLLEFLAASHLARESENPTVQLDLVSEIKNYFGNPSGHVMLWMLVGKLKNPSPLLKEIIALVDQQLEFPSEDLPFGGSPIVAELLVDCLSECGGSTLDREAVDRSWEIISRGMDRKQRMQRKKGGEWASLADWSLIFRAMKTIEIHEGPISRAEEVLELIEVIRHGDLIERNKEALINVDKRLKAGLKSTCSVVRWTTVWIIATLVAKGQSDIQTKYGLLVEETLQHDQSQYVRCIAARALVRMGRPNILGLLGSALDHECPSTATGAAIGLSRLMTSESISRLTAKAESLFAESPSSARDRRINAVIGALEGVIDRAKKSGINSSLQLFLKNKELADIFLTALQYPLLLVRGTAASALGKMKWKSAWKSLRHLAETPDDGTVSTARMRASVCYACDQLTEVISKPRLQEAARLFQKLLGERGNAPGVRRPAASGILRLLRRKFYSPRLVNELLKSAQDEDIVVAKSSLLALMELKHDEALEDMTLLLQQLNTRQKLLVCQSVRDHPSETGIMSIQWLLNNDTDPKILASAVDVIGQAYKKALRWRKSKPLDFLNNVELLHNFVDRAISLSYHKIPNVVASSITIFQVFPLLYQFRKGESLSLYGETMKARVHSLLSHEHPFVQSSAIGALALWGSKDDLKLLAEFKEQSPSKKVRKTAEYAYDFIKRRLS